MEEKLVEGDFMTNLLGNYSFWLDLVTAVGTVGATIVALWLGLRENIHQIDGLFIWGSPSEYQPQLWIQNMGKRTVVIEHIIVYYKKQKILQMNLFDEFSLRNYAVIEAGKNETIPIDTERLKIDSPVDAQRKYMLKIIVTPRQGRKFVSKQKYSYEELCVLFFSQELFSDK